MTDDTHPPAPEAEAARPPARRGRLGRPKTLVGWMAAALAAVAVLAAVGLVVARYGVLTPPGRAMIEARANGLKLGRFGRLHVEGLTGDIWRRFNIRRATIADEKGVWLEANDMQVDWSYAQLLRRRLDVDVVNARLVRVLRRPTLEAKGVSKGMPVSVRIGAAATRVEMLPAFSNQRGVYDLNLSNLNMGRTGGFRVGVQATSVLHPGDFLTVRADVGRDKSLMVEADALEARGGSIAGALGLDDTRTFSLQARATGTTSEGKLSLLSHSGDLVPLRAGGAWGKPGGAVDAYLLLSSSRLLKDWETKFGSQAHFSIVGKQAKQGLYDLDVRLTAPNLTLTAQGPADTAKRSTTGLTTRALVPDMNKLLSYPLMGRGEASGLLVGTFPQWRFQGPAAIYDISTSENFRIAKASGPATVDFKNNEFEILADIQAQGGSGDGWEMAVAGPTPHAKVKVSRLRDGRLLYRSIDATGNGLRLEGAGTQSALGGLNFKGDMQVFNLETAHDGAGGSASGTWTATQKDVEHPWMISFDAAGDKFTSGYPELDRLMGKAPRVKGDAEIFQGEVKVPKVVVTGVAATLTAQGVQDKLGQIKYDGTWTANGPFVAGPVEITGDMKGKGVMTGTWLEPKLDLTADIDTLALPSLNVHPGVIAMTFVKDAQNVFVGGIGLTGGSDYGPARVKSGFRFAEDGLDLKGIDADLGGVRAQGSLSLRASTPSSADLSVQIAKGALLTEGAVEGVLRIVDQPGGPVASVRLQTAGAVLRASPIVIEKGAFVADGPLAKLPYRVNATGGANQYPVVMNGGGFISQVGENWDATFDGGGELRTTKFATAEPIRLHYGPGEQSARLRLTLGGGNASVDARQAGEDLSMTAALDNVDVRFLSEDFLGRFDADMKLVGKGKVLNGDLNARLSGARSRDAPASLAMDGQVKAILADDRVTIDAMVTGGQGLKASTNIVLPAQTAAAPFRIALVRNAPIQGRFDADGEVQPLWDLFLGGERTLGGRLVTHASIGGTINDPRVTGQATLQNGKFEDYATGLKLRDVDMQAQLQGNQIMVDRFSAKDPLKGTVAGSGRASLERNGGSDFNLKLTSFRLIDNELAVADATGDLILTRGGEGNIKIVGALTIDQAEINAATKLATNVAAMDVVEVNRPIALQTQIAPVVRRGPGAELDVRLRSPRRIYVRGRGLDVEMSLDAHVTGVTADPNLQGTARLVRGQYEFAGKTFDFDERGIVQLSTRPELIRLDLRASREDPTLTAVVRILGTAANPEITLTSTPVLPNDEVLSQVLFGRSASQLSPLEAAQLASALTGLAGGGGFDVIGNLRSFAGLDRLAFAGGSGGTAVSVAGGKYLTEDVYLEIAGGGRDGPSAQVEYRVNRSLSVISRLTSEAGAKLAVRWRRDLGERRRAQGGRR